MHVLDRSDLPHSRTATAFEGERYGDVSFFVSDSPPGHGPALHRHPYAEVFVVFVNAGAGRARHVDLDASARMETEWLAEDGGAA